MRHAALTRCVVILGVLVVALSCGHRETPEERLERLRLGHEIVPLGYQTIYSAEGEPTLLVDLQVSNRIADPLGQLTILVRIRGSHGIDKTTRRVTLDMSAVRPGVGVQMPATLPGVELTEEDEVTVEIESNLPVDDLHSLPEWQEVAAASQG